MSNKLAWRVAIGLFTIFLAFFYLTPTLTGKIPKWWADHLPSDKIHLGLDLRGGMHLVLEVQSEKAVESHLERMVEELKGELRKDKMKYLKVVRRGPRELTVTLVRPEDGEAFEAKIRRIYGDFEITPSLDEEGKPAFSLVMKEEAAEHVRKMAVDQALETIRNRIDQFGVTEPDIRPQENDRILIQLPGEKDSQRAISILQQTAQLEFKLVDDEHSVEDALKGNIPPGGEIVWEYVTDPKTKAQVKHTPYLLKKRTLLTGEYITDARVQIDNRYNEPYVSLSFDTKGARLFERITEENIKKRLAIVLDNKVNSAPVIQDKISGGQAQITGRFTLDDAKDLTIVLRAGALPAPVKVIEERTVGPSLGKDSIDMGKKAMIVGTLLVVVFMVVYYRLSGLIADLALLVNILFIMAGLAFFGATLTLPGLAGIVLTIGMAVDANVLIFERVREELRAGKTPRSAVEAGYEKAFSAIMDSNVTTLIAGLILFQFGTGPVRGFAVTLSIGIISTMYTAIFLTRIIFDYLYVNRMMKKISI